MGLFKEIQDQLARIQQQNRENQKERTAPREVFDRMRQKVEEMQANAAERRANKPVKTGGGGLFSSIKEHLERNRNENEASELEETAEASIFNRMKAELERMEQQKDQYEELAHEDETCEDEAPIESNESNSLDDFFGNLSTGRSNNKEMGEYRQEMETIPTPKPNPIPMPTNIPTYEPPTTHRMPSNMQIGSMATIEGNGGSLAMRITNHITAGQNAERLPDGAQVRILEYSDQNKINLDGQLAGWYKVEHNGQIGWVLDMYLR